jgi:hypothetical protein
LLGATLARGFVWVLFTGLAFNARSALAPTQSLLRWKLETGKILKLFFAARAFDFASLRLGVAPTIAIATFLA